MLLLVLMLKRLLLLCGRFVACCKLLLLGLLDYIHTLIGPSRALLPDKDCFLHSLAV